jgi:hypothetical protein
MMVVVAYKGLGYYFDIDVNFMPEDEFPGVRGVEFYVFGKKLTELTRD